MPDAERWLDGAHAVITGAGRGIGAAIAGALARRGARLSLMARTVTELRARAGELRAAYGVQAEIIACDVTDDVSVAAAFARARDAHGEPAVLVNNAGMGDAARFTAMERALWDRTLAVNLTGTYLCTAQVLPAMLAARAGRVVNVASTAGLRGYRTMSAYCASKHGVIGLTRALALETAAHGVTVNAVCPGFTETAMTDQATANIVAARGVSPEDARAMLVRTIPRGMLTSPAEVADAVAWLCSPAAAAVTGVALPIAGGEVS